jgi:acyl dehydratase
MQGGVCYEDVNEGTETPALTKHPTTRQLVMWAGASGDFYEIHYDKDFARSQGLDGVIVHGRLKLAFMAQLITDWIGTDGVLKKLTCQYRGMDVPHTDITVKGTVTKKYLKKWGALGGARRLDGRSHRGENYAGYSSRWSPFQG